MRHRTLGWMTLVGALLIVSFLAVTLVVIPRVSAAGNGVLHYGPIPSTSPDSGTCGKNWANDSFDRFFSINPRTPNTVTEEFKNGTFVTVAGQSPGACQTGADNGNTVADGITGKLEGTFDIQVSGGSFNPNATCSPSTCNTTAGFIQTVYGCSGCSVAGATYFIFHYSTGKNGQWKNASANRGGNDGDITGTP